MLAVYRSISGQFMISRQIVPVSARSGENTEELLKVVYAVSAVRTAVLR